jgi:ABC-type uncharacterized transport system fused permease/ATPase subunit
MSTQSVLLSIVPQTRRSRAILVGTVGAVLFAYRQFSASSADESAAAAAAEEAASNVDRAAIAAGRSGKAVKKSAEEKKDEKPKEKKKLTIGAILKEVKILDAIRYVSELTYDLLNPGNMAKRHPKDYVKRLLNIVWNESSKGKQYVLLLLLLSIARILVVSFSSDTLRQMTQIVYNKNPQGFKGKLLWRIIILTILGSGISSLQTYAKDCLAISWRDVLTKSIHDNYFKMMNYYHIGNLPKGSTIVDPDERIAREVYSVSKRLTNLVYLLIRSVPPVIWFTFQMTRKAGFKLAFVPQLYLLVAYELAQRVFPKNIGDLRRRMAAAESMFSKIVSRTQTHAESIAALGGASQEKAIVLKSFHGVTNVIDDVNYAQSKYGAIFKLAYTYGCRSWILWFLMLPVVTSPKDSTKAAGEMGQYKLLTEYLVESLVSTGNLLTLHALSLHMIGEAKRIWTLIETLQTLAASGLNQRNENMVEGSDIRFENVQVFTPTGNHLVKDLSFSLGKGDNLLLTGHNGAGKSSSRFQELSCFVDFVL